MDIVAYNLDTTYVQFWQGKGDGTFGPRVDRALDVEPYDVALGDVDGDNDLDIVATALTNATDYFRHLFRNNGTGTFAAPTARPIVAATRNRLVEVINAEGGITRYEHDASDNRTALIDPAGNRTQFAYDRRSRLIRETDPRGESIVFEHGAAGNRTAKVDRNGRRIEYVYDNLDSLVTKTWIVPNAAPANVIESAYDAAGNLLSLLDSFRALTYTYDNRNRVRTVDNAGTTGAPRVVLTSTYDDLGNVLSVSDTIDGNPGGTNDSMNDALNRVVQITQGGTSLSEKRVHFTYNEFGQFATIDRFADLAGI